MRLFTFSFTFDITYPTLFHSYLIFHSQNISKLFSLLFTQSKIFSIFNNKPKMTKQINGSSNTKDNNIIRAGRQTLSVLLHSSEPNIFITTNKQHENNESDRRISLSPKMSSSLSPVRHFMSPIKYMQSPYSKSPWTNLPYGSDRENGYIGNTGLIGSLIREGGHIYSLALSGDLLYTGSDSKNIRVWKNLLEFSGFYSSSGLVKAILVFGDQIFTGHQDGKIRVWKYSGKRKKGYKRVGNLPTTKDFIKSSMKPSNYIEVRRSRNVPWIKHFDVVTCMSLDKEHGLLYSGSWDRSIKVWQLSNFKCLESIDAHNDAINSVVVGFDSLVFTGSTDGTVKVWRRELVGKAKKHILVYTLLDQESAVTCVVVNTTDDTVYAGSSDGLINFWEFEKQALNHGGVLRGHKLAVLCLATAGNLLLSGSADKSICVWRREGGGIHTCLSVLNGHTGPVKCLAVQERSKDEEDDENHQEWVVYSGSLDNSVNLWRVSEQPQICNT